jgi:hypothetical protein
LVGAEETVLTVLDGRKTVETVFIAQRCQSPGFSRVLMRRKSGRLAGEIAAPKK